MWFFKKTSPRRSQVRKNITAERFWQINRFANIDRLSSALLWLLFVVLCVPILSFELIQQSRYRDLIPITVIVVLISLAAAFYIHHYQRRIIKNHIRALALVGLFILLLATTKLGVLLADQTSTSWATGTAVTAAVILTVAYDQRFAIGMSIFYCLFACFAAEATSVIPAQAGINLFLTMAAGVFTCCFSLREIRTRMKLLEVSALAAVIVFITAVSLGLWANHRPADVFSNAGFHAAAAFLAGLLIQSLLPVIEKTFRIATSMTLLDYSDANQPLLKK
ncbi:MAG TPA: hypothetical protein ENH43_01810, partial [Phycisphaerales bacterium]|nr:hypothetical protein [Phycisphaerales bacterium]